MNLNIKIDDDLHNRILETAEQNRSTLPETIRRVLGGLFPKPEDPDIETLTVRIGFMDVRFCIVRSKTDLKYELFDNCQYGVCLGYCWNEAKGWEYVFLYNEGGKNESLA